MTGGRSLFHPAFTTSELRLTAVGVEVAAAAAVEAAGAAAVAGVAAVAWVAGCPPTHARTAAR